MTLQRGLAFVNRHGLRSGQAGQAAADRDIDGRVRIAANIWRMGLLAEIQRLSTQGEVSFAANRTQIAGHIQPLTHGR